MSDCSNSANAAIHAPINCVLLSSDHITRTSQTHAHHTPPTAHQQRATQARIWANPRDSVWFRGSSTAFLISLLVLKRHKFTSLLKNISKSYSMISSRCLIQNSVLQLPLFIYVLNASHSYNYLVYKIFILYGEIFNKRRTFVSNNVLFHAPSSGHIEINRLSL